MKQKILFTDLDGTLLNDAKEITPGNRAAIQQAISAGHKVVIASGRPLSSAVMQAGRLKLDQPGCYLIAYNGGSIYDFAQQKEIFRRTLQPETVCRLFDEANCRGLHIQTYDTKELVVEPRCDDEIIRSYCSLTNMTYRVTPDIRKDPMEPPVKVLMIEPENRTFIEQMQTWVQTELADDTSCFFSSREFLEVVPLGINKGSAIQKLCGLLDLPLENAVAIGDESNDISMIEAAGVGAAVQNAIEPVKKAADYIAQRDNNHDAVAEVIEKFML